MTGRKGKRKIKTVRNDLESRETKNGKKLERREICREIKTETKCNGEKII